ncbi:ATP-binding protein (plasmid) [Vibrio cyclitrophicus]|uniref:ATP-binding protein n=3 Tax=Vibrio TaxID=662 RepID=UPI000C82B998|nr:ATP-binding protein [Vibrio cyclitrophicus]PMJ43416.1 hypothetical protein BCU22_09685 [Vibrio cyclitrophicus]
MSKIDVHLYKELERIDLCLQQFVVNNRPQLDGHVLDGFILDENSVLKRLSEPCYRPSWADGEASEMPLYYDDTMESRLSHLVQRFGLNAFEIDVLLLGVLEEFDSRYADLFEVLHRSHQKRMASFELALKVLQPELEDRAESHVALVCGGALLKYRLLEVFEDDRKGWNQTLFRTAKSVFHYLLGNDVLSNELNRCARWSDEQFKETKASSLVAQALTMQASTLDNQMHPIVVLHGTQDSPRLPVVTFTAKEKSHGVLALDMSLLPDSLQKAKPLIYEAIREVKLHDALLVVEQWDELTQSRKGIVSAWKEALYQACVRVMVFSEESSQRISLPNLPHMAIEMPALSHQEKIALLERYLKKTERKKVDVESLCRRFSFNQSTLPKILQEARCYASLMKRGSQITMDGLSTALRYHSQKSFGTLAQRIEAKRGLDDLIGTAELKAQLQEIMIAVKHREAVLQKGFGQKIGYGTGISVLFHGNSGTGKTLAAEIIAGLLNVDLVKVDLSVVVDKYIGETEKNLARIFDLAERDSGVLFFDEADALFGKRTAVNDAKDRNANLGVSYLLQRLERYSGLVILATNNRGHLDEAFSRRFTFITRFHFPDEKLRAQMWRNAWPQEFKIAKDVDFERIATRAELTGANIRNVALLSAWLAEEEGKSTIHSAHIQQAIKRELAKIGRLTL